MKSREEALSLLKEYNKEEFHIRHGLTVESVMKTFARNRGYSEDEVSYWGLVGMLHDVDFEMYPDQHCVKCVEILKNAGFDDEFIHSIVSHGYMLCSDVKPEKEMEKVLYAVDELTGLIWSASLMRPSKSTKDMEVKSVRKKFKDKAFAAGCDREVIRRGAEMMGIELDQLFDETIKAMRIAEDEIDL